jgi:hypothetical protein
MEEQDRITAARQLRAEVREILNWLNSTDDRHTRRELARHAFALVQAAEALVPFASVALTSPSRPQRPSPTLKFDNSKSESRSVSRSTGLKRPISQALCPATLAQASRKPGHVLLKF